MGGTSTSSCMPFSLDNRPLQRGVKITSTSCQQGSTLTRRYKPHDRQHVLPRLQHTGTKITNCTQGGGVGRGWGDEGRGGEWGGEEGWSLEGYGRGGFGVNCGAARSLEGHGRAGKGGTGWRGWVDDGYGVGDRGSFRGRTKKKGC